MLTSRTAIETYLSDCQYKRFLQWHKKVKTDKGIYEGLQLTSESIDTAFGTAVHLVIEELLKGENFDSALQKGKEYFLEQKSRVIDYKSVSDFQASYSFLEYVDLLEALTLAWQFTEGKAIRENFEVISTEKEIKTYLGTYLTHNIFLQSRVDAVLRDKTEDEYQTYSLKTTKMLGIFSEAMQNRDLQGSLEKFATENLFEVNQSRKKELIKAAANLELSNKDYTDLVNFLNVKIPEVEQIGAIRFCFLVKGNRTEDKENGVWVRDNPLIYGWRKKSGEEYQYAHSYWYANAENKSGKSRLGAGWEKFRISTDYPGGIEEWIRDIINAKIQPEAENPLNRIVYVPEPVRRLKAEDERIVKLAISVEKEVLEKLNETDPSRLFLKNTKSCSWPSPCEMESICEWSNTGKFSQQIADDPIGSGLYQIRVNHHIGK